MVRLLKDGEPVFDIVTRVTHYCEECDVHIRPRTIAFRPALHKRASSRRRYCIGCTAPEPPYTPEEPCPSPSP